MPSTIRRILFASILVLAVLACNLPVSTSPTQDPGAVYTSAAQTVAAAINQTLVSPLTTQSFTQVSVDPVTPLPTLTLTPTLSATPIFSATPSIPLVSVTVDTNCRVGPGKVYDYLGGLFVGQTAEVYGKNSTGDYFYIRLPENPNIYCWVTGQYASLVGNVSILPIFTPPPTPTPMPSFQFAYVDLDGCVGWWVNLKIRNTGAVAFKSFSLSVKDLNTGTTLTSSGNGFTELVGCLVSSTILSLEPNQSAILSGPAFNYNPNNHNMRATLTLCTLPGQTGLCLKDAINFKP